MSYTVKDLIKDQLRKAYNVSTEKEGKANGIRYTLLSVVEVPTDVEYLSDRERELAERIEYMREIGACEIVLVEPVSIEEE